MTQGESEGEGVKGWGWGKRLPLRPRASFSSLKGHGPSPILALPPHFSGGEPAGPLVEPEREQ